MFEPKPEFHMLSLFNRLCELERRLNTVESGQRDQEDLSDNLQRRVTHIESRQDRSDEIEHLVNRNSPDGDPVCNYYTSRIQGDEES
jgi:hypothetical protein